MNRIDLDLFPQALPQGWVSGEGLHLGGMVVGVAPGNKEWEEKRPFVGDTGQFLREELTATGLNSDDMYLTNVVKVCRNDEIQPLIDAALPYLKEEIQYVVPKYILALGEEVYQTLTGSILKIDLYRGIWSRLDEKFDWDEALVLPTYDPGIAMQNHRMLKVFRRDLTEFANAWLKGAPNERGS